MRRFLAIMLVVNAGEGYHNFLLETVGMGALTLAHYDVYWWCYDVINTKAMLWNKIFSTLDYDKIQFRLNTITKVLKINGYCGYVFAVYLLCLWALIWINRPEKICIKDQNVNYRCLMTGRLAVNIIIAAIPFGVIFLNILDQALL